MVPQMETLPEAEDPDSKQLKSSTEERDPVADTITPAGLRLAAGIAHFAQKYKRTDGEFDLDKYLDEINGQE